MERKSSTQYNIEKNIEDFYNKYTKCKICNIKNILKRYYENKDKRTNQKIYILKKIEINCYKKINKQFIKNYLDYMLNQKTS